MHGVLNRVVVIWISLHLSAQAGDVVFKRHVINAGTDYSAAAVMDVNHDGQLDIVCGGDWYEAPDWTRHFVRNVPRIRGRPDGFAHLTLDVNRDGWMDVVTLNYRSSSIKWIEHPGATLGTWKTHVVVRPGPMETGRLVDIDSDGQVDLLPNGARFAAWWELKWNGESGTAPKWIRHDLPSEAQGHGFGFGDIDGDGRGDIVGQFGWLQAPENPRTGRWHWNPDFHLERASAPMIVADVDEDGDSDIVWTSAHGFGVYWLEQTKEKPTGRTWHRHTIDASWSQGHGPLWVDLDGDGRKEFVAGKRFMSHGGKDPGAYDPMVVYRYQFEPGTRTWRRSTVSTGERVGLGLDPKAEDIDGDGDLDLIASGRSGLYLLENLGSSVPPTAVRVPEYRDHIERFVVVGRDGDVRQVETAEDLGLRRSHMVAAIEADLGPLPSPHERVCLDVELEATSTAASAHRTISYRVDARRRVRADLFVPENAAIGATPGIVCTLESSDAERTQALLMELCQLGHVCLLTRPVLVREEADDTGVTMDAVWQVMRAVDALQSLRQVDGEQIGYIADGPFARTAPFAAALDQRIVATFAVATEDAFDTRTNSSADTEAAKSYTAADVFAAIAPRAVSLQISGTESAAADFRKSIVRAQVAFALRNVPANLGVVQAGSDRVPGDRGRTELHNWLNSHLK